MLARALKDQLQAGSAIVQQQKLSLTQFQVGRITLQLAYALTHHKGKRERGNRSGGDIPVKEHCATLVRLYSLAYDVTPLLDANTARV